MWREERRLLVLISMLLRLIGRCENAAISLAVEKRP